MKSLFHINKNIQQIAIVGFAGFLQDYTLTHFRMPGIGTAIIGSVLQNKGFKVKIFAEGVKPLDKKDLDYICASDVLAVSVLTYGANRAYSFCSFVKEVNPGIIIIMGDVHATIMPEHALQHCDYVIRGEGDQTILELISAISTGMPSVNEIKNLSFSEGNKIVHNPQGERPQNIEVDTDLSLIENFYNLSLTKSFLRGKMTLAVAQATRGCPVACKFCLGSAILGRDYRTRTYEGIIRNLNMIRHESKNKRIHVFFIDNNFFINKTWTKELLRRIILEKYNFNFIAFGQYAIGKDSEMLELLNQANFVRIFVGFESTNPQTLKEFNKRQTEETMLECISNMHKYKVPVHGSFILGGETDTLETAEETIQFAIDTGIATASFYGLCEYPFEMHDFIPASNLLNKNRLLPDNLDYYNLNFASIYPRLMRPSQLQEKLIEAHERFYSVRRISSSIIKGDLSTAIRLTIGHWAQRRMIKQMKAYLPYLHEMEKGKYDSGNNLIEENLKTFTGVYKNETTDKKIFHKIYGIST